MWVVLIGYLPLPEQRFYAKTLLSFMEILVESTSEAEVILSMGVKNISLLHH